jgi:hypothetical protein
VVVYKMNIYHYHNGDSTIIYDNTRLLLISAMFVAVGGNCDEDEMNLREGAVGPR